MTKGRGVDVVWLSIGGVIGVNARHWLAVWINSRAGGGFPWATFTINVTGSFLIGVLATVLPRFWPSTSARLFFMVGLLGGYTTFSSFALEGHALWIKGQLARSLVYLGGSVAAGFVAVVLGVLLGDAVIGRPETPEQVASLEDARGILD